MKYPGDQDNHQGEKMGTSFEGKDKNGEKGWHHTEESLQEDRFVLCCFEMIAIVLLCMQELPPDTTAQLIQTYQTEVQSILTFQCCNVYLHAVRSTKVDGNKR